VRSYLKQNTADTLRLYVRSGLPLEGTVEVLDPNGGELFAVDPLDVPWFGVVVEVQADAGDGRNVARVRVVSPVQGGREAPRGARLERVRLEALAGPARWPVVERIEVLPVEDRTWTPYPEAWLHLRVESGFEPVVVSFPQLEVPVPAQHLGELNLYHQARWGWQELTAPPQSLGDLQALLAAGPTYDPLDPDSYPDDPFDDWDPAWTWPPSGPVPETYPEFEPWPPLAWPPITETLEAWEGDAETNSASTYFGVVLQPARVELTVGDFLDVFPECESWTRRLFDPSTWSRILASAADDLEVLLGKHGIRTHLIADDRELVPILARCVKVSLANNNLVPKGYGDQRPEYKAEIREELENYANDALRNAYLDTNQSGTITETEARRPPRIQPRSR